MTFPELAHELDELVSWGVDESVLGTMVTVTPGAQLIHERGSVCVDSSGLEKEMRYSSIEADERCPACFDSVIIRTSELNAAHMMGAYVVEVLKAGPLYTDLAEVGEKLKESLEHLEFIKTVMRERPGPWSAVSERATIKLEKEIAQLRAIHGSPEHKEALRLLCSEQVGVYGGMYLAVIRTLRRNALHKDLLNTFKVIEKDDLFLIRAPGEVLEYLGVPEDMRFDVESGSPDDEILEGALVLSAEGGMYSSLSAAIIAAQAF